jgi:type IV pilus assembly protein PilB
MSRRLIGQCMLEASLIDNNQLEEALRVQRTAGERVLLGRIVLDKGFVKEEDFAPFIASYFDVPYVNLMEHRRVRWDALDMIPETIAERLNVFPLAKESGTLTVALTDPVDLVTLETLEMLTHCRIRPVVSTTSQIQFAIFLYYFIL